MDNQTLKSFFDDAEPHGGDWYAGMAALVAAIAAAIGSVIYASKHIKSSECWGSKCTQQVVLEQVVADQPTRTNESNV
jgi:hypothetical protein